MRRNPPYTHQTNHSRNGGEVLGDQIMAAAVLVRILHHCTVVNIKGETYRIKDRKRNSLPTMKKEGEK